MQCGVANQKFGVPVGGFQGGAMPSFSSYRVYAAVMQPTKICVFSMQYAWFGQSAKINSSANARFTVALRTAVLSPSNTWRS